MWNGEDSILRQYHRRHAFYPQKRLTKLKTLLKPILDDYIRALAVEGIQCSVKYTGSVAEGVRIVPPDKTLELDIELVMDGSGAWVSPLDRTCCVALMNRNRKKRVGGLPRSFLDQAGHISAKLVLDIFYEVFGSLTSVDDVFRKQHGCLVYFEHGPAVTMKVAHGHHPWFSVDFVPAVCVPGRGCYVPKQRPGGPRYDFAWRESFSFEEIDQYPGRERPWAKHCLRILKAFCAASPEMKPLGTYVLKNLLFLEVDDRPSDSWQSEDVAHRVWGLLARLRRGLKERDIPQYFNQEVNLLRDTSDSAMQDMWRYLNDLLWDHQAFVEAFSQ